MEGARDFRLNPIDISALDFSCHRAFSLRENVLVGIYLTGNGECELWAVPRLPPREMVWEDL